MDRKIASVATFATASAKVPDHPPPRPGTRAAGSDPNGSWTIVPGLLSVKWAYKAATEEVDVSVDVLWWSIETLSGSLTKDRLLLKDGVDIFGLIKGWFSVEVVFDQVSGGDALGSAA